MPMYWQCPRCLIVAYDFPPTPPETRKCVGCNTTGHTVFTWPGTPGEVYHAALHNLGNNDDWTSVALRAILLCSLTDVHDSRMMWTAVHVAGAPGGLAEVVVKELRQATHGRLLCRLVGEKRRRVERTCYSNDFWSALDRVREFRNRFVHCEPETQDKEMRTIAVGLKDIIDEVKANIEPAFQALTNEVIARVRKRRPDVTRAAE